LEEIILSIAYMRICAIGGPFVHNMFITSHSFPYVAPRVGPGAVCKWASVYVSK